jgi:hypothetical protein
MHSLGEAIKCRFTSDVMSEPMMIILVALLVLYGLAWHNRAAKDL